MSTDTKVPGMSGPEYAPGAVAVATVGGTVGRIVMRTSDPLRPWVCENGQGWHSDVTEVRPLVVLDLGEHFDGLNLTLAGDFLAAAAKVMIQSGGETREVRFLRWLVEQFDAQTHPAKPAEPAGLGAVVEDAEGGCWIRCLRGGSDSTNDDWQRAGYRDDPNPTRRWFFYREINAVRVLSDGVPS